MRLEQDGKGTGSDSGDAIGEVGDIGRRGSSLGGRGGSGLAGSRRGGVGGTRGSGAGGPARGADLSLGRVEGAALALDGGLALVLGLGAGRVGGDAVRVGLLADELAAGLAGLRSIPGGQVGGPDSSTHSRHGLDVVLQARGGTVGAGADVGEGVLLRLSDGGSISIFLSQRTYRIAVVGGRVAAAEDAARVILGVAPIGWPTVSPDAQKQQQAMRFMCNPYTCLQASPRTD